MGVDKQTGGVRGRGHLLPIEVPIHANPGFIKMTDRRGQNVGFDRLITGG